MALEQARAQLEIEIGRPLRPALYDALILGAGDGPTAFSSSCAAQSNGKKRPKPSRADPSIPRFNLFELAAQYGLEFVELLRAQGGRATFNITFNVWICGAEFEASNTGRHIESQRS